MGGGKVGDLYFFDVAVAAGVDGGQVGWGTLLFDHDLDGDEDGVPDGCEGDFVRGDVNLDLILDIADPIGLLGHLFGGPLCPCLASLDSNRDGSINIADAITLLSFLFASGAAPESPFPGCGSEIRPLPCAVSGCP